MKKIFISVLAILFLTAAPGFALACNCDHGKDGKAACSDENCGDCADGTCNNPHHHGHDKHHKTADAKFKPDVTVKISGMTCSSCVKNVTGALSKQGSVMNVDVSLKSKLAKVKLKDGETLSDEKIKELISSLGYKVEKIQRKN